MLGGPCLIANSRSLLFSYILSFHLFLVEREKLLLGSLDIPSPLCCGVDVTCHKKSEEKFLGRKANDDLAYACCLFAQSQPSALPPPPQKKEF